MKEFSDEIVLRYPLNEAFRLVFDDPRIMTHMHSNTEFSVSDWKDNRRVFHFELGGSGGDVMGILGGGKLSATARQEKKVDSKHNTIIVTHKIKPHFVGAELVKLRPVFTLIGMPDGTSSLLRLHTRVDAIMMPPFNGMVEGFIIDLCKANHQTFRGALSAAGLIANENS